MQTWQLYYYTHVQSGKDPYSWGGGNSRGLGLRVEAEYLWEVSVPVLVLGNPGGDVELFCFPLWSWLGGRWEWP